jgi:hypothetical protein
MWQQVLPKEPRCPQFISPCKLSLPHVIPWKGLQLAFRGSPSFWARATAASVFSYDLLKTEIGNPFSATFRARFCTQALSLGQGQADSDHTNHGMGHSNAARTKACTIHLA